MTAFENNQNKKKMPVDYTTMTSDDLLGVIQQGFLSEPQGAALTELQARIVKNGDVDDVVNSSNEHVFEKGIRPRHAPLVP